ncbi:23492_t:CDS:1, partial [Dentiscutata erythropus]
SSITEVKKKREVLGLLDEEERKPKVNKSLIQRIGGNTIKIAEHNSDSVKKDHRKENWLPKSQKKTKYTDNPDPENNNSIHNMLSKILD